LPTEAIEAGCVYIGRYVSIERSCRYIYTGSCCQQRP
jgi:hypothetical protein